MAQARNDMRPIGGAATVPLMALEPTNDGAAAAYAPMKIDDPSEDDGAPGGVLPEAPPVA